MVSPFSLTIPGSTKWPYVFAQRFPGQLPDTNQIKFHFSAQPRARIQSLSDNQIIFFSALLAP